MVLGIFSSIGAAVCDSSLANLSYQNSCYILPARGAASRSSEQGETVLLLLVGLQAVVRALMTSSKPLTETRLYCTNSTISIAVLSTLLCAASLVVGGTPHPTLRTINDVLTTLNISSSDGIRPEPQLAYLEFSKRPRTSRPQRNRAPGYLHSLSHRIHCVSAHVTGFLWRDFFAYLHVSVLFTLDLT